MKPTVCMDRTQLEDLLKDVWYRVESADEAFELIDEAMTKLEKEHDKLRAKDYKDGWELENFRQTQRDNFHGDGQW